MAEPLPIAVPSWVIPATVAENAVFLAGRVAEVELCFYEARACLAYARRDLPASLARLPLRWHIHLPFDLFALDDPPGTALRLLEKAAHLGARRVILHPPETPEALARFVDGWKKAGRRRGDILLENTPQTPLARALELAGETGCGLCPDLGHALLERRSDASGSLEKSWEEAASRASLIHVSAPGEGSRHAPLTAISSRERTFAARGLARIPRNCLPVLELYSWPDILLSWPLLKTLLPRDHPSRHPPAPPLDRKRGMPYSN